MLEGRHILLLSDPIIVETTKVLGYPRLQKIYPLTDHQLYDYAQFWYRVSETVSLDPVYNAPLARCQRNQ